MISFALNKIHCPFQTTQCFHLSYKLGNSPRNSRRIKSLNFSCIILTNMKLQFIELSSDSINVDECLLNWNFFFRSICCSARLIFSHRIGDIYAFLFFFLINFLGEKKFILWIISEDARVANWNLWGSTCEKVFCVPVKKSWKQQRLPEKRTTFSMIKAFYFLTFLD